MLYMILKDGFEETEAIATLDFIKRGNVEIKTVSDKETVTGTHGVKVGVDILFSEIHYITPAVGAHTGAGLVGLGVFWED